MRLFSSIVSLLSAALISTTMHSASAQEIDSLLQARKHFSFGYRYLMNKQYEDAKKQLFKSWSFNPKRAQTAYYIGRFYNETEQYDQAVEWFQKTLKLDTRRKYAANTWYYLSQIYLLKEDRPKAIEAFEALLNLSPERERKLLYLHHLVSLYVEGGDYESALKYARMWGELEPDNPDVQDTIAKLALSTGEENEALKKMEKGRGDQPGGRVAELSGKTGSVGRTIEAFEQSPIIRDYGFSFDKSYTIQSGENKGKSVYHYRDENSLTIEVMLGKNSETIEHYAMVVPIDTPPRVASKMLVFLGNLIDKSVPLSEVAGFVRRGMDGYETISKEFLGCKVRVTPTPVAGIAVVTMIPTELQQIQDKKIIKNTPQVVYVHTKRQVKLVPEPKPYGKTLKVIPPGKKLLVVGSTTFFWKVKYKGIIGYVSDIDTVEKLPSTLKTVYEALEKDIRHLLSTGKVKIGMEDYKVQKIIGMPDHINRTVGVNGIHEQWVYQKEEVYLYFDDGVLTGWQE